MRYIHTCPYCEAETAVTSAQIGKRMKCPNCDADFTVPGKVRDNPAPDPDQKKRHRREDPDAARRAGLLLGLMIGFLGLLGTGVAVACLFLFTNVFDRAKDDTARNADAAEKNPPEVKPEPKPEPKTPPKTEPKREPKVEPKTEPKVEPKKEPKIEPKTEPKVEPKIDPVIPPDPKLPVGKLPGDRPDRPPFPFDKLPADRPPVDPVVPPVDPPKPADPPRAKITFPVAAPVELTPAPLAQDATEVKLPDKVGDAVVGGGGRYWCLLLPDAKQVAIFDANQAKVAKYVPIANSKALIAAGMNKLLIVYPDTELVVRYDLGTFEKEATVKLPFRGTVKQMCLGSASAGPMLVFYDKGGGGFASSVAFLDIATFKELDAGVDAARQPFMNGTMHFRTSPDGRAYGGWSTSGSPTGLHSLVLSEDGLKTKYEHDSVGSIVPNADGTLITGAGLFTSELKVIGKKEWAAGMRVPAQQGDWYLGVTPAKNNDFGFPDRNQANPARTAVYKTTDTRPVVSLGDIGMTLGNDAWAAHDFTQDKRVLFSPAGNLIAWIAPTNDKLHLYKFDLDAALEKSGVDYLFVTSRPPGAVPGQAYKYTLAVKSKKGGATFKLDAGPAGMKIAPDGTLTWDVPKDYAGNESVIITVSDKSGQEVFHTFTLGKAPPAPAGGGEPVAVKPPDPKIEPKVEPKVEPKIEPKVEPKRPDPVAADPKPGLIRPAANPAKITPTKAADKAEVKLPGAVDMTCLGGGGRFVLLRIPKSKQVAVLDVCEGKVAKYIPIAEENALIAAGNEHLFVLNPSANVIQRWSLTTFEKEATVPNPTGGTPTALLVGHATDGPVFVVGPNKLLDGKTFKEVDVGGRNGRGLGGLSVHPSHVRISADGRVLAWFNQGVSPSGLNSLVLGEGEPKAHNQHTTVGAIIPGPDGTLFSAGGIYTPELKLVAGNKMYQYWYHAPIPAAHGNLYLTIPPNDLPGNRGAGPRVLLKMLGHEAALAELSGLEGLDIPKDHNQTVARGLQLHDRVFLVPDAKAMAVLSASADKVYIHKVDLEALLEKAGVDYLFVVSRPPGAVRGAKFTYKPEVKSRKGGVTVKLDAGPDGMKVADGTVTWDVPKDFAEANVTVILTVSDKSGQELFHTFTLPVADRR